MKLKNIYASKEKAVLNCFLCINRRIRTSAGEFSDMENLSPAEYPCTMDCNGSIIVMPKLTFDSFLDKSVMYIRIQDGFLNIYTSVNNGKWVPHKGIDKSGKHRLPIRYSPGDILRLRIEGSGRVCITEMELEVVTKGGS